MPGRRNDPASSSLKKHGIYLARVFILVIVKGNEDETGRFASQPPTFAR